MDGCGRPISHISPRVMQVKRVHCEGSLKSSDVTFDEKPS